MTLSGADSGKFDLSATYILTFKAAPNFESPVDANEDNAYTRYRWWPPTATAKPLSGT